ncbi:SDR family NAD(P)-dependent oxidoreductase [Pseudonocardia nematodicida]|uniref:SDR family NAD(P)-dependent oxidoreductase n=1 Tax=Pseudonocardia nematodicida TaxID=1206997 RepID=A0ABV1K3B2_9PSEU
MLSATGIAGRAALVTGAASGIGRATVLALARDGVRVLAVDRQPVDEVCAAAGDGTVVGVHGDVTDAASVTAAVSRAVEEFGGLDIAVHCAGVVSETAIEDLERPEWDLQLDVNLTGSYAVSRAVLPHLSAAGAGRLVLFSSIAARVGGVNSGAAYVASKGGVGALGKWLARRYGPAGVTVNMIAPGPVDSPMTHGRDYAPEAYPVPRMGTPEELAAAVVFLVSDAAAWITGHTLDVNGGIYMN